MTLCWDFIEICSWVDVLKLVIACILGGIIGWEREMTHHPAGLRTHLLVALGSTLFVLVAYTAAATAPVGVIIQPGRIMQGVITGVGFIGAGAIMKAGLNVHGLTTAASLWVAAAVGLLVGIGALPLAGIATAVAVGALFLSRHRGDEDAAEKESATPKEEAPGK